MRTPITLPAMTTQDAEIRFKAVKATRDDICKQIMDGFNNGMSHQKRTALQKKGNEIEPEFYALINILSQDTPGITDRSICAYIIQETRDCD